MAAPTVTVCETDSQVAEKLCSFVIEKANEAIKNNGVFYVALSGKFYVFLSMTQGRCLLIG